jgi:hypothetical protein
MAKAQRRIMQRWEFFLRADRVENMADVSSARRWATEFVERAQRARPVESAGLKLSAPLGALHLIAESNPTAEDAAVWERSVQALRSVAKRVAGFSKPRNFTIKPMEADELMASYISRLIPELVRGTKSIQEARVRYRVPTRSAPPIGEMFKVAASMFFEALFASFIQPDRVCGMCGESLGASKARRCKRCKNRDWWYSLDPTDRARREREKKARQRARDKAENPTTKKAK